MHHHFWLPFALMWLTSKLVSFTICYVTYWGCGTAGTRRKPCQDGSGSWACSHALQFHSHPFCLYFSRIVVVFCLRETIKAATPWMDTSSARPAIPPASGCWPPRQALTCRVGRPLSCRACGTEKNETQDKDKRRNRKIEAKLSTPGMVSVLHLLLTFPLEAHTGWDLSSYQIHISHLIM